MMSCKNKQCKIHATDKQVKKASKQPKIISSFFLSYQFPRSDVLVTVTEYHAAIIAASNLSAITSIIASLT